MKTLFVLRHAKSSRDSDTGKDFDRPLNDRGRNAAVVVGREMRARKWLPDLVVASPAARVVETLTGAEEGFGGALAPAYDQRIYDASPATLLEVVRAADDKADRLLLVGHNPGLQMLLLLISEDDDRGLRAEIAGKFPTGALAEIRLPIDHWRDTGEKAGRIQSLVRPRDSD